MTMIVSESCTYSLPLLMESQDSNIDVQAIVHGCSVRKEKNGFLTFYKEGYIPKTFPNDYIDFFFSMGYITEDK